MCKLRIHRGYLNTLPLLGTYIGNATAIALPYCLECLNQYLLWIDERYYRKIVGFYIEIYRHRLNLPSAIKVVLVAGMPGGRLRNRGKQLDFDLDLGY